MSGYSSSVGRYFQIETMGAVDGPGLRLVLFLQGCSLRCPYCHNPESWAVDGGSLITVDDVLHKLRRYRSYYRDGGLTLSGGEPLLQPGFVSELLRSCAAEGIHTALDTSGAVDDPAVLEVADLADLLLLDIKFPDPGQHFHKLGIPLNMPLALLERREEQKRPVWIRHVVVPGITSGMASIDRLAELVAPYRCVQKVELLPFRKLCLEKYAQMGLSFKLKDTPEMQGEVMLSLVRHLQSRLPDVEIS